MVRLKNGDLITEEIKKAFKEKTTYSYLDVYNGETLEYTFSYDDYLTKVEYYDDKCDPEDGKFIGKATTRQIDVEIKNIKIYTKKMSLLDNRFFFYYQIFFIYLAIYIYKE